MNFQEKEKRSIIRMWNYRMCFKKRSLEVVIILSVILLSAQLFIISLQNSITFRKLLHGVNIYFLKPATLPPVIDCEPKFNVAFMKIHKTGSSTVQNIFLRYAIAKNLTLLMPRGKSNYFGHPAYFNKKYVPKLKKGFQYNMFCFHIRWHYREIRSQMPNNTVFVTVLREPNKVFESLYLYYDLHDVYNVTFNDFVLSKKQLSRRNSRKFGRFGRNQMSFDLGLGTNEFENSSEIDQLIRRLDQQFDLVMIAEFMEESLVLLRQLLCWDIDDVIVFQQNVRVNKTTSFLANQSIVDGSTWWNQADNKLYGYFVRRLRSRISEFGEENMKRQVQQLRTRTKQWMDDCVGHVKAARFLKKNQRPYHPNTYGYALKENVKNATCERLTMTELPFLEQLKAKQRNMYVIPRLISIKKRKKQKTLTLK